MSEPVVLSRSGLSSAEAAARLERDGPNLLPAKPPTPLWRRVAGHFVIP